MSNMFDDFVDDDFSAPAAPSSEALSAMGDKKVGDNTISMGGFHSTRFKTELPFQTGVIGQDCYILILPGVVPFSDAAAVRMKAEGKDVYQMTPAARTEAVLPGNFHQTSGVMNGVAYALSPLMVGTYYGDNRRDVAPMNEMWDTHTLGSLYPSLFGDAARAPCLARNASQAWNGHFSALKEKWKDNPKVTGLLPKYGLVFYGIQIMAPDKTSAVPNIYSFSISPGEKQMGLGAKLLEACKVFASPLISSGVQLRGPIATSLIDPKNPGKLYVYKVTKKQVEGKEEDRARNTSYNSPEILLVDSSPVEQYLRKAGWGGTDALLTHVKEKIFPVIMAKPLASQFKFLDAQEQETALQRYCGHYGYQLNIDGRGNVKVEAGVLPSHASTAPVAPTPAKGPVTAESLVASFDDNAVADIRGRKTLLSVLNSSHVLAYLREDNLASSVPAIVTVITGVPTGDPSMVDVIRELTDKLHDVGRIGTAAMSVELLTHLGIEDGTPPETEIRDILINATVDWFSNKQLG